MPEEAKIKVSLDLDEAHAQLTGLYRRMGGGPSVGVSGGGGSTGRGGVAAPGMGGGGGGAARGGGGGGGFGLGGLGLGRFAPMALAATAAATFGRTAMSDATSAIGLMTKPIANKVSQFLFGEMGPDVVGQQKGLEAVKSAAALAVGYGADKEQFRPLFEVVADMEQKREKGSRAFDSFADNVEVGGVVGELKKLLETIGPVADFVLGPFAAALRRMGH